MNTEVQNNVGASQEAVAAQNTNEVSFAEKAKKVASNVRNAAEKAVFPVIATACVVSSVACATYRVIELVRLLRGDEK